MNSIMATLNFPMTTSVRPARVFSAAISHRCQPCNFYLNPTKTLSSPSHITTATATATAGASTIEIEPLDTQIVDSLPLKKVLIVFNYEIVSPFLFKFVMIR